MTTPPPLEPVDVAAPDAVWQAIRNEAVGELRDGPWTDHNVSDPGITMLEAAALSIADLHYRIAAHQFADAQISTRFWSSEPAHWSHVDLPSDTAGLAAIAKHMADHGVSIAAHIVGASDRSQAIGAIVSDPVMNLGWAQAAAVVRVVRARVVARGALDHAGAIDAAIEMKSGDEDQARLLLRNDPSFSEFWDSEIEDLFRLRGRRRLVEMVMGLSDIIASAEDLWALVSDLAIDNGLDAQEVIGALALHPDPQAAWPELFEDVDGATFVWPPHAIQSRTVEPVTEEDYVSVVRLNSDVRRAWVTRGHLGGAVNWDGTTVAADSDHPGALTIIVDPVEGVAADLPMAVHRSLAGPSEVAEVDDPHRLFRDDLDVLSPRRVMCDEIAVAMLSRCEIVVKASLHVAVGTVGDRRVVIERAESRLREFFVSGRPESQPELRSDETFEGPWPKPDPAPSGWIPGEPIRLNEVIAILADDPAVLGVTDVALRRPGGPWYPSGSASAPFDMALDPHCVPVLADDQCITVTFVLEGQ